jgi:hypothetical protein
MEVRSPDACINCLIGTPPFKYSISRNKTENKQKKCKDSKNK